MHNETIDILFLNVASHTFAVDVAQVETLRRKETVFPAREGPPDLLGFLPMGRVKVPILDLGIRLGIQQTKREIGMLIVAPPDLAPLAFRVDYVEGPSSVAWSALSLLPKLLRDLQFRQVVWGLAERDDALVPLIDLQQIVPPDEVTRLLDLADVD